MLRLRPGRHGAAALAAAALLAPTSWGSLTSSSAALGAAPLGTTAAAPTASSALDRYSRELSRWARFDAEDLARIDYADVADTVEKSFSVRRTDRDDVDLALLEFVGATRSLRAVPSIDALHRYLASALGQRIDGRGGTGFEDWVRAHVLGPSTEASAAQRAAACDALAGHLTDANVAALVEVARSDSSSLVRTAALRGIAGYPLLTVGRVLVEATEARDGEERAAARRFLVGHLNVLTGEEEYEGAWNADLQARLVTSALPLLVHEDWRVASNAVHLAAHCDFDDVAPRCIEALYAWERRELLVEEPARLVGMRRIQHELGDLLRSGSGLVLGIDPRRWTQWWRSHLAGAERPQVSSRTVAPDFFGLELRSAAVAFVIDASGSMDRPTPGKYAEEAGPTRFEQACVQLASALDKLPEPATIRVVLFSNDAEQWSDDPRLVNATSRSSIRHWLRRNGPGGGTNLAAGLDALIPRDRDGVPRPEHVDVDTVVVLCDGQTNQDAGWARGWLQTYNVRANLVFHCVQIGGSRADALEALAERTGGQFLRVD